MTKLFAVGFPRDMDEMQLAQLFGPFGDIELLTIVRDKISGKNKGYGFIHMKTESGAIEAINFLNGHVFGDRRLEVRIAMEKETETPPSIRNAGSRQSRPTAYPEKKKRPRIIK